jgi:LytS/YehU family sensor histidine kinase
VKNSHQIANNYRLAKAIITSHAVFNYLTALQNQITFDQKRDALNGLSAYARFSRQILQNAEFTQNSCEKELELLQMYLNMEKMRFESSFDSEIKMLCSKHHVLPTFVIIPLTELIIAVSPKPVALQIEISDECLSVSVNAHNKSFESIEMNFEQISRYGLFKEQLKLNNLQMEVTNPQKNLTLYQVNLENSTQPQ